MPAELATRCPVINSRIVLTQPQRLAEQARVYVFRACTNLDNCYHRPDFIDIIPECCLHQQHGLD